MGIIVLGSINVDLQATLPRFAASGETLIAHTLAVSSGGKGANQALAARRMGAAVSLIGRIGNDSYGKMALSKIQKAGVNLEGVQTMDEMSTGLAWIEIDAKGHNRITVAPGANQYVGDEELTRLSNTLRSEDQLLLQLEVPPWVVGEAIRIGKERGARVYLDPAPIPAEWLDALWKADVILPNQHEASALVKKTIATLEDACEGARFIQQHIAGAVVLKLGEQGLVCATPQAIYTIPPYLVDTVDDTGAGDVLVGALAAFVDEGRSFEHALRYAAQAAALATTRKGTQEAIPFREEIEVANSTL